MLCGGVGEGGENAVIWGEGRSFLCLCAGDGLVGGYGFGMVCGRSLFFIEIFGVGGDR